MSAFESGCRKHAPARFDTYIQIHNTRMHQFERDDWIQSHSVELGRLGNSHLIIEGQIRCLDPVLIDVRKLLVLTESSAGEDLVQTVDYSYNVFLGSFGNVFRYDSPHIDHHQENHVHRYDVLNGDVHGTVEMISDGELVPTLGEVIEEARVWYFENIDKLPRFGLAK